MRLSCPIILFLLFPAGIFAMGDNPAIGARSVALGGASVAISDVWSTQNNQAGLAFLRNPEIGINTQQNFLLSQVSLHALAITVPTKQGAFGLNITRFGYVQYNESKIGFAYAKSFGDVISASVQLNYLNTFIGDIYGTKRAFTAETGIQAKISKSLTLGAHLYNPTRTRAATYNNERIPTILRLGLQYNFSDKVFAVLETAKDIDLKPVFKAGVEYKIVKELTLRGGIATNPTLSSFGFSINIKPVSIDFAASFHQQLGITPNIGMRYVFEKKGK